MCVICYLSTDRDIADIPFDESKAGFNIHKIDERPLCLTKRFVYYCGSSHHCGCGFGNLRITEEILNETEQELIAGPLSQEMEWKWWNQDTPPPKNKDEFDDQAKEIRGSRRDTLALHQLIRDTCEAGYPCEILIFWDGAQNNPVENYHDIDLRKDAIAIDFETLHTSVKNYNSLYRFSKDQEKPINEL